MRCPALAPALVLLTSFAQTTTALEALQNSPCAVQCGNILSSTTGSDIVCQNGDFTGTSQGVTFSTCISCQLGSKYVDPATKQTDLQWGLYNLRYAMSWCLFGYPNNTNVGDSPCVTSTACGPLQDAFEFDSLSPAAGEYSFCPLLSATTVPKCNACLAVNTNEFYLVNFLTALNAGCQQQPNPGSTISIQGSLFSTTAVNLTSPSSAPTGTYSPSTSALTLGGKIGIAVGGILVILFITGFCIIWTGKRRRRQALRERQKASGFDDWRKHHDFRGEEGVLGGNVSVPAATPPMDSHYFDSPDSARPLHSWAVAPAGRSDETPTTGPGEKAYFSPYTSNYNSPVSATDQIQVYAREWPRDRKGSFNSPHPMSAVEDLHLVNREWPIDRKNSFSKPTEPGRYPGRSRSTEQNDANGGRIEMQDVTPVLRHPGHGRSDSIPLTEEDLRNGNAL